MQRTTLALEPFYLRYHGDAIDLPGDQGAGTLKGVALCKSGAGRLQLMLLAERPVGTKGKVEYADRVVPLGCGLEAILKEDGNSLLLRTDDPNHRLHLPLRHHKVNATDGRGALNAFAAVLAHALDGRVDTAIPTEDAIRAALQAQPLAKRPRLIGGHTPSNLGSFAGGRNNLSIASGSSFGSRSTPPLNLWGPKASSQGGRLHAAAPGASVSKPAPFVLPPAQSRAAPEVPRKPGASVSKPAPFVLPPAAVPAPAPSPMPAPVPASGASASLELKVSILPRTPELQRRMDTLGLRKSSIKCAPPSHPRHPASTAHMPLRR